jgi:fimbrial chaperone protein
VILPLAAGVAVAGGPPAQATPVSVTPTSVALAPDRTTDLISLLNEGDAPARFEVTLSSWVESQDGKTLLEPTKDLVAFPPLIEIPPHQTKNIRIGMVGSFAPSERSYRMIVQELPSATPSAAQVAIQVLTKISLPVFAAPPGVEPAARIETPKIENGVLSFSVFNPGTAHMVLRKVEIAGQGSVGPSFDVGETGWYVLAGGRRDYQVALARTDCQKTSRLTITATSDGPKAETQLPVTSGTCGQGAATRFLAAGQTQTPAR